MPSIAVIVQILYQTILVSFLHVSIVIIHSDYAAIYIYLLPVTIAVPNLHTAILEPLLSGPLLCIDNNLCNLSTGAGHCGTCCWSLGHQRYLWLRYSSRDQTHARLQRICWTELQCRLGFRVIQSVFFIRRKLFYMSKQQNIQRKERLKIENICLPLFSFQKHIPLWLFQNTWRLTGVRNGSKTSWYFFSKQFFINVWKYEMKYGMYSFQSSSTN